MNGLDVPMWLHGFVLPLVAGGDVRVRGPLDARAMDALLGAPAGGADELSTARIAEARHAITAEILLDPPAPVLDADALRLAAATQNLLFLAHPGAAGSRRRRAEVARFAVQLATLDPPSSAGALADRHSILHHLFAIGRDDVRVSFWAGRREFRGSEPPPRLLKWSSLRRVREERWRVAVVAEALADARSVEREIVAALLAASPLTDLMEPSRPSGEPRFFLRPLVGWLRDAHIARAVADRYLTAGLEQVALPLTAAAVELYHLSRASAEARVATAFLCHLQLLVLLGEAELPELTRKIRMETLVQTHEPIRDFFGLFAAAHRFGLSRPADLARDRRVAALVESHLRLCRALAGAARVRELEALLEPAVGEPPLELPAERTDAR